MLNWLLEPLSFEFMRNAIVIAIMLGVLGSAAGSYLIVQRMGLLGDVIAHAVLPGLAIAFFFGVNIFIDAFISGMLSTLVITRIQSQSLVKVDVAMALVFSGFLALGIMLITLLKSCSAPLMLWNVFSTKSVPNQMKLALSQMRTVV